MERGTEAGAFAQVLAALKRHGSGLLVVGAAADAQLSACNRLLGDDAADPRRRVVVLTGSAADASARLDGDDYPENTRVVDRRELARSAAAVQAAPASPSPPDLDGLEADVVDAVDAHAAAAGTLAPAELRVCIDSVGPLLDANPTDDVRSFLDAVVDRVRSVDGMVHVHLPTPYDAPPVADLEPAFDGVVEVAPGEQRWHIRDEGITTDWLPL